MKEAASLIEPIAGIVTLRGVFQFAHVWRNTNGEWKVARVLSYGH
ncbi:MAG TPA: hypothetical protein VE010_19565 [Thermoanaerobaculia bacterium]|nr:hypothetical protein [Thermoanaerobaculia bacterium]